MSICLIEDIAENTSAPFWFQLYVMRDRGFIEGLIDRAKAAKCSALVLTMDLQILGQRHKDIRNGLSAPPKFTLKHVWQMAIGPQWALGMLAFRNLVGHVENVGDLGQLAAWTNSPSSSPTTADGSLTARRRRSGFCRKSSTRSAAGRRCTSTAESARDRIS